MPSQFLITGKCAGGCGAPLAYQVYEPGDGYAPELSVNGANVQYRGGHLCLTCEAIVESALSARRAK